MKAFIGSIALFIVLALASCTAQKALADSDIGEVLSASNTPFDSPITTVGKGNEYEFTIAVKDSGQYYFDYVWLGETSYEPILSRALLDYDRHTPFSAGEIATLKVTISNKVDMSTVPNVDKNYEGEAMVAIRHEDLIHYLPVARIKELLSE